MRIGICSPITISEFVPYLDEVSRSLSFGLIGLTAPSVDALVHQFIALGHYVVVFTLAKEIKKDIVLEGEQIRIYVGRYRKKGFMRSHTFFFNEIMALRRFVYKEPRLDIIHAHWTYEFAIGALAAKCPVFCTVRDVAEEVLKLMPSFYRRMRKWMNDYVLRHDTRVSFIANSPYTKERLLEYHPSLRIVAVVPNPCGFPALNSLPHSKDRILSCVSVSQGGGKLKNIETLVKAFKLVREEFPNAELHLIGAPFEKKNWRGDLPQGIVLMGAIPHVDLPNALLPATVMVHPSLEESFGNVIIEAMACGVPVIGGVRSGAVPYVLDYGRAGVLCDVSDEKVIAKKIIELFNDPLRRRYYVDAGLTRVKETFSIEAVCNQIIKLYENVLNGSGDLMNVAIHKEITI